jgi:glycosyltransferase involved in cell wall biosynthesis
MSALLTIAIPTFNRVAYLKELIPELLLQCAEVDPECEKIEVLISDNASTDSTRQYIKSFQEKRMLYYCNETNIGGDANFIECVKKAKGEYVWLFGDDEIICRGGMGKLVNRLEKTRASLVITFSDLPESKMYASYNALLKDALRYDKVFPVHHTLITSNVFLHSIFDIKAAHQHILTNYGHMYALMHALSESGSVFVFGSNESIITIREHRAEFQITPLNLEQKVTDYVFCLGTLLHNYKVKKNVLLFYALKRSGFYKRFKKFRMRIQNVFK